MATVRVGELAIEDLDGLIASHGLPADTRSRVVRSLRPLERFPRIGRELEGRWAGTRLLVGSWPWMLIVYTHDEDSDVATVLTIHDARMSAAATSRPTDRT